MRLIDADKLKTTKGMFIYQTEDADVIATEAYRWELIEREAPTVEAIPIEWFKKKMDWLLENGIYGAEVYQWVLNRWYEDKENWEKENERP